MNSVIKVGHDTVAQTTVKKENATYKRPPMKERPKDLPKRKLLHDKLRHNDLITKTKINIETALNTPGYAYRGMKGDPDFNFFEFLKVSKIPYYLGGLGLAAVCLAGKDPNTASSAKANHHLVKKVLTGVILYYAAREVANAVIDIPVRLFRGIDLNMPYRKITSLREGNPLNLPNNKKPSNQSVFESTEFTRWDLLYRHSKNRPMNATFDNLAKKFGVKDRQNDSDSKLMPKIRKLMVMSTAWKYMLSVPFVTVALGMAQQSAFENTNFRSFLKKTVELFKPSTNDRFRRFGISAKENIFKPLGKSFVQLWQGNSTASKIIGRTSIIAAAGLTILANAMILSKTSLSDDNNQRRRNV